MGRVQVWLLVAAGIASAIPAGAQQPTGSLVGRVIDQDGRPLAGALFELREPPSVVARTDANGEFEILGIPVGENMIRVFRIGYEFTAAPIRIQEGGSQRMDFSLHPTIMNISHQWQGPDTATAQAATELLERVLMDTAFIEGVAELWEDDSSREVLVWAEWMIHEEEVRIGNDPIFVALRDCERCVARAFTSMEGGSMYEAAVHHVKLGVRSIGTTPTRLEFCVTVAQMGASLPRTCYDIPPLEIPYFEVEPGGWIRFEPWCVPSPNRPAC